MRCERGQLDDGRQVVARQRPGAVRRRRRSSGCPARPATRWHAPPPRSATPGRAAAHRCPTTRTRSPLMPRAPLMLRTSADRLVPLGPDADDGHGHAGALLDRRDVAPCGAGQVGQARALARGPASSRRTSRRPARRAPAAPRWRRLAGHQRPVDAIAGAHLHLGRPHRMSILLSMILVTLLTWTA